MLTFLFHCEWKWNYQDNIRDQAIENRYINTNHYPNIHLNVLYSQLKLLLICQQYYLEFGLSPYLCQYDYSQC